MGREVRMVPAGWEHPTDENGNYIPLMDGFNERLARWDEESAKWDQGLVSDWNGGWQPKPADCHSETFADWSGERPEPSEYMPDWPVEQRTHFQMYEDTSEGTPISPVMETPERLARWLADNGASAFGSMTATYAQWMATIQAGYAVGMVADSRHGLRSGVAANVAED